MMNLTVSILMSTYSAESYIGKAIESILNQTYQDFEFLIIDDGSTDSTSEIIEFYRSKDDRIIFMKNQQNRGLSFSLNKGLEVAKGKYIARMDADDVSLPNRLETQVSFMDTHKDVAVSSAWMKTLGKKNETIWKSPETHEEILARLFCNNCIWHPVSIIRKDVLDELGLRYNENYTKGQDYRLWVDIAKHQKLANIPKILHWYRIHEDQRTKLPGNYNKSKNQLQALKDLPGVRVEMLMEFLSREVTLEEVETHQKLFFEIPFFEKDELIKLSKWVDYLIDVNKKRQIYIEPEFSENLKDTLFRTKAKSFKYYCSTNKRFTPKILWKLFFSGDKYYLHFSVKELFYLILNSLAFRRNKKYSSG
ncbi:MAG: glycosyltransferase family 2 protein [Balneolaceae bacterium]|nr:glycosyltransferase family 2 protein [Balneolaceae bacterium]